MEWEFFTPMMLITGCKGVLGSEFSTVYKNALQLDIHNCDISEYKNLLHYDRLNFDTIINCVAYTNVDECEKEQNRDVVFKANVVGVKNLVDFANKKKSKLIHFSTDYVFSGDTETDYKEDDTRHPIQVYGESKLQAEHIIENECENYLIVRISWLFGRQGSNFIKHVINLLKQNKEVYLLNNSFGTPTFTGAIVKCFPVFKKQNGIIHFTNRSHGKLSWFDYGRRIAEIGGFNVELVKPIESLERIAKRPKNSTLNIEKASQLVNIDYWDEDLQKIISYFDKIFIKTI